MFLSLRSSRYRIAIKHDDKVNVGCEWITEVTMAKTDQHVLIWIKINRLLICIFDKYYISFKLEGLYHKQK